MREGRDALGKDALNVNWIGVTISDANGKVTYPSAFITSLAVSRANIAEIAACARARWKIENETFNVLKNNGYHLEHNSGHSKRHLAMTFAAMNLLAFAFHTVCDCLEGLWTVPDRCQLVGSPAVAGLLLLARGCDTASSSR